MPGDSIFGNGSGSGVFSPDSGSASLAHAPAAASPVSAVDLSFPGSTGAPSLPTALSAPSAAVPVLLDIPAAAFPAPASPVENYSVANPRAILAAHIASLEKWALANERDARRDMWSFWALKIPAILAASAGGILAQYGWASAGAILGVIASVSVIIDGIYPRGMLHNTHVRAVHDLRDLTNHMWVTLDSTAGPADEIVRTIIRDSEKKRQEIAAYVRDAEIALNYKGPSSPS